MYKIVFLLVFSVKVTVPESQVYVTIYFEKNSTTGLSVVKCEPDMQEYVMTEEQEININIQAKSPLRDFWCQNAFGATIYNSVLNSEAYLQYSLNPIVSSKTNTDGTWTCNFQIKKPRDMQTAEQIVRYNNKEYIPSICNLQFNVTEPPKVSLNIEQLNEYYGINEKQGKKKSNVTFTDEEEIRYDCSLSNPTENNERYKIMYYLDGKLKNYAEVSIKPHSKGTLSYNFEIEKADHVILCTAVDLGPDKGAPNPRIEINLQYIPQLPELTIGGLTNLQKGEFIAARPMQMYSYNYTDGDFVKVSCNARGNETRYNLAFHFDGNLVKELKEVTFIDHYFKLNESNKDISCAALDKKTGKSLVTHVIQLHYRAPDFTIRGLQNLRKGNFFAENSTQMYDYDFTNDEIITLLCDTRITEKTYNLAFYLDKTQKDERRDTTSLNHQFKLRKNNQQISCIASDKTSGRPVETHIVRLHYNSQFEQIVVSAKVDLSVTGLPDDSCVTKGPYNLEKTCNYTYSDPALVGTTIQLQCTLTGQLQATYTVTLGTYKKQVQDKDTQRTISKEISLTGKNETEVCQATRSGGGFNFSVEVHIYYIPPPPTTTEPSTTSTENLTTQTQVEITTAVQNADAASPAVKEQNSNWWLKFVLGGGALFITVCVVCCFVFYRRKKPPPEDSTYANLAKDQNSYQTLPVAAPRTLKPGEKGPKVTVNGTYSEPKDSQDMSDALYADPNRLNGSDTYAEPYVKSATKSKNESDYAEPYLQKSDGGYAEIVKSEGNYAEIVKPEGNYAEIVKPEGDYAAIGNSEGNYAVIGKNSDNKELYAKPIPKALRPVKVKDESNYSNVFTEQYANTKK